MFVIAKKWSIHVVIEDEDPLPPDDGGDAGGVDGGAPASAGPAALPGGGAGEKLW